MCARPGRSAVAALAALAALGALALAAVLPAAGQTARTTPGPAPNDEFTAIHAIQGAGQASPLAGRWVLTRGVVTGVKSNGFFLQEPDASVDADPATSEGVFVFTSGAPPAAAVFGNYVMVGGTVTEYVPASDPLSPPTTEITAPAVTFLSSGVVPMPAPIPLTTTLPDPTGAFDQLERLEGMRVSVASLTVTAPTQGTVTEASATSVSKGVFYGVVTGVPRPFLEPGLAVPDDPTAFPGTVPPIPRYDSNPERIRVDSAGQKGGVKIDVGTGAVLTGLVGPLDYAYRCYSIVLDPPPAAQPSVAGGPAPRAVSDPTGHEFTVATFNVERFYDTVNDGAKSDVVLTQAAFDLRLSKASLAIRRFLKNPDVLGLEEMENLQTLQALAARISSDAAAASEPDPQYAAYLVEGNDVGGIDVAFLVKTAPVKPSTPRVSVAAVVQELAGTPFRNPDGTTELLNDRPPLRMTASVNFANAAPFPVTVIVNHLKAISSVGDPSAGSKGWATVGARERAKRQRQAEDLAGLVQARQAADGAERIVLVGDFNAYEFNDGYGDILGTIAGTPPQGDETVVPGDGAVLVNPPLVNLVHTPPAAERYSYTFDGNAQNLDHVLVNAALASATAARRIEHARIDADFPDVLRNEIASPCRISDHDPAVAYFRVALSHEPAAPVRKWGSPAR